MIHLMDEADRQELLRLVEEERPKSVRRVGAFDFDAFVALTDADKAYIAGFFDGEGSVGVYHKAYKENAKKYYTVKMAFSQRKAGTLLWLHGIFGGALVNVKHSNGVSRPYHDLVIEDRKIIRIILRALLPYLREKKDQVELLLAFIEPNSEEDGDAVVEQMAALKRVV
jgi:hypothetical protein